MVRGWFVRWGVGVVCEVGAVGEETIQTLQCWYLIENSMALLPLNTL